MLDILFAEMLTPGFVYGVLIALAVAATIITIAMPLMETDVLEQRMKSVAVERERVRARERERLSRTESKGSVRFVQKDFMKRVADQFQLKKWLSTDQARMQLAKAGFRGEPAEVAFMFFRLVTPLIMFVLALVYIFGVIDWDQPPLIKFAACIAVAYAGIKAPEVYLTNVATKRQLSLNRAYPNALDLLLICIESGMSIELAFRKVSVEIGVESVAMAEEFALSTAELSYLPDRRVAFENLAQRTGLPAMKSLATVMNQSEKYGTSLGTGLRVLAQESRDERMTIAEKKAAGLPPKLTVPMILFFLPVLIVVIIFPAAIGAMGWT
eukprot:gene7040-7103_t